MSFWCQKYDQIDVLRPFLFDCETQKLYNFLAFFAEVRKTKKFKKLLLWKKLHIQKSTTTTTSRWRLVSQKILTLQKSVEVIKKFVMIIHHRLISFIGS